MTNSLHIVIDRVAHCDVSIEVFFDNNEVKSWDRGEFDVLLQLGLLKQAQNYKNYVLCNGCEEGCFRDVETILKNGADEARAVIVCDQRDDVGYISADFDDLIQWHSSGDMFAEALLKHIKTAPVPYLGLRNGEEWPLGLLRGVPLFLKLSHAIGLVLVIDKEHITLQDLLNIKKKTLFVDWQLIENVLAKVSYQEPTKEKARRLLRRKKELKLKGVKNFLQVIKKEENMQSDTWLKELIKMAEEEEKTEKQKTGQFLQNTNWINN